MEEQGIEKENLMVATQQEKPFPLRMGSTLRKFFESEAKLSNRSLNAEVIFHLTAVMEARLSEPQPVSSLKHQDAAIDAIDVVIGGVRYVPERR